MQLDGTIDSIKLKELNFSNDVIVYRGKISGNFSSTNPDSLEGKLFILESLLVHNQQRFTMDSIQLLAANQDSLQSLTLTSDILQAELKGKYKLTEMGTVLQNAVEPYFSTDSIAAAKNKLSPYDFTINARLVNKPILKVFIDSLRKLDTVSVQSHLHREGLECIDYCAAVKVGAKPLMIL